jgi:hypothetical protein
MIDCGGDDALPLDQANEGHGDAQCGAWRVIDSLPVDSS